VESSYGLELAISANEVESGEEFEMVDEVAQWEGWSELEQPQRTAEEQQEHQEDLLRQCRQEVAISRESKHYGPRF
jgi:hypothetical protein